MLLANVYALPAKPTPMGWRSRLSADIDRERLTLPCCIVGHSINQRVHVTGKAGSHWRVSDTRKMGKADFLPILAGKDGRRHVLPSAVSLFGVKVPPAKPASAGGQASPVLTGRRSRLSADIGR